MKHSSGAAWRLYFRPILCSCIGLVSHVVHDFVAKHRTQQILSLVSYDQKQIPNMLDLKTQSLAIKIVNLKLPHRAEFLD